MFRNTYYSKTRIISCRFWKTSLRWTILLESVQADSMAISCRISMEQSWPIRTLEQNLAAYVMPVSRWTHFLTVVKMPLKNNQKRKFVKWLNVKLHSLWFHKKYILCKNILFWSCNCLFARSLRCWWAGRGPRWPWLRRRTRPCRQWRTYPWCS